MRITIDNICLVVAVGLHLALAAALHQKTQERYTPPQIAFAELIPAPASEQPTKSTQAPAPKPQTRPKQEQSKPAPQVQKSIAKAPPILRTEQASAVEHAAAPEPVKEPAPSVAPTAAKAEAVATAPSNASQSSSVQGAGSSAEVPETAPIYNAAYLSNPSPAYPRLSLELEEEGRVMLRVQVSENGQPLNISIVQSSGFSRLDKAAQETVKRWRFVPAKRGDQAVVGTVRVPIDFKIKANS